MQETETGQERELNSFALTHSVATSYGDIDIETDGTMTVTSGGGGGMTSLIGDVTGAGSGEVTTTIAALSVASGMIQSSAVTLAKIANASASSRLLGSGSAGNGIAYSEIIVGGGLSLSTNTLSVPTAGLSLTKITVAGEHNKLLGSGDSGAGSAYTELSIGSGLSMTGTTLSVDDVAGIDTLTGDVTATGSGSVAATIAAGAVTYAQMQLVAASSKLIGSGASGAGAAPVEITLGAGLLMTGTTVSASGSSTALSTGVVTGGALSIATGTTFDISDGNGWIVDVSVDPPVATAISWTGKTGITVTDIATQLITFVSINSAGTVIQQGTRWTSSQARDQILLGVVVHVDLTSIDAVNQQQSLSTQIGPGLYDLYEGIGFINASGNNFSPAGASLAINKTLGSLLVHGSNFTTDPKAPNVLSNAALLPCTIQYRVGEGTNYSTGAVVLPDLYDDGTATPAAVSNNKFTVQRVYLFTSNNVKIQFGQTIYNTMADAKAAIQIQTFTTEPSIAANGALRAFLVIRKGTTDLTNTADAFILDAGKFGQVAGASGLSVSTLQAAYDNSALEPEILTQDGQGPISLRRGTTGGDTDAVIEVENNAGTSNLTIRGDGNISSTFAAAVAADLMRKGEYDTGLATKQPLHVLLTSLAALRISAGDMIVGDGTDSVIDFSTAAFGRSVLSAADAAALLALAGGQASSSELTAIAALTGAALGRSLLEVATMQEAQTAIGINDPQANVWFADFLVANVSANGLNNNNSGSGAGTTQMWPFTTSTNNAQGVIGLGTGTTASGYCSINHGSNAIVSDTAAFKLACRSQFLALSTASDEFIYRFGFSNDVTSNGQGTHEIGFRYDRLVDGVNWQCVTRVSGTETVTDSGVAATASATGAAMQELEIRWAEGITSVTFYIGGALVATHTTNLYSGRFGFGAELEATAYTSVEPEIGIDWIRMEYTRATAR